MQISKLLIPQVVIENNPNFQSVFNLLQFDEKNQKHDTVIIDANYEPLQLLKHQVDLGNDDSYTFSINDVHNNDKKILSLLDEEVWSTYSFKALERKLDIHQQSLTRALKRLKDLGMIEKTPSGYKLIKKNIPLSNAILENIQLEEGELESSETKKTRKRFNQLIQIRIPVRNNIELIVNRLIGKWFGNLRWFGLIKKETGFTLQWIAIHKYNNNKLFQINVNIVSEYVVIESNAVTDKEKVEAMLYSNKIVGEIVKILQDNLLQEECNLSTDNYEIQKEYSPTCTNKVKYNFNKNN